MFEVTKLATDKLNEYFEGKERKPIRIFLNSGGWGGPRLNLALDETKDTDSIFDINGFQFIIDEDLLGKAAPIKVDFAYFGFHLECALEPEAACSWHDM